MHPFGGIRLSGCLLVCRGGKTRRPEVFPHTLICLRAPAESVIASRVKSLKFHSESQNDKKKGKKQTKTCPSLFLIYFFIFGEDRGRRWSGVVPGGSLPNTAPPQGELIFSAPLYIHCCSPVEETERGVCSQTPSTELTPEWRLEEQTKQIERGGGGPRWEATPSTSPATLEAETPLSFISILRRLDVGSAGGSLERQKSEKKKKKKTTDN